MNETTLIVGSAVAFIAASVYAFIGYRLSRRRVSWEARAALQLFGVWWFALAGSTALGGITRLLASSGTDDLVLYTVTTYLNIMLICIALWGLLYYLLYLFTGSRSWFVPLTVGYLVYFLSLVYLINQAQPVGVEVGAWNVRLAYARDIGGLATQLALGLLVLPQILGALAYSSLLLRVRNPTQRYRIALVASSILVWFGSAYLASISGVSQEAWWQVASQTIGLVAAGVLLAAYFPPAAIRKRFGIQSLREEPIETQAYA